MLFNVAFALQQIKQNVAKALSRQAIEEACHAEKYPWRQRTLGPVETLWAFLLQVLHGNTACEHVVRLAQLACSATAYCQARRRIPLAVYKRLLKKTTQAARGAHASSLWHGHRTLVIDGTGFSMPDTEALRAHYGTPSGQANGCGFPVAHLLALFDTATGLLIEAWDGPVYTHDMKEVVRLHPQLQADDILLGDTAFASYAHLALLSGRNVHGLFRMHQRQLVSFRADRRLKGKLPKGTTATQARSRLICKLGRFDQVVEYQRIAKPKWLSQEAFNVLPQTLQVRELRYWTKRPGFRSTVITLVTTLLDAQRYPLEALADLYGQRWGVETNFAHLKTTMKMNVLRCESVAGVQKELIIFALVYNLVRLVMLAAAVREKVPVTRISFIDALRWLEEACIRAPALKLVVNPQRPGRYEPRLKKRRPNSYSLMTQARKRLQQQLRTNKVTA